jgi:hypothetical protein
LLSYYEKVYLELSLSPLLSCCELRESSSCDFIVVRVRILGRFIARTLLVGIRAAGRQHVQQLQERLARVEAAGNNRDDSYRGSDDETYGDDDEEFNPFHDKPHLGVQ